MRATQVDVEAELAALGRHLDRFEELRAGGPAVLGQRAPTVSAWSVEQHLYHIALATDLAFRNVRSLVSGKGALIVQEGALTPEAAVVLTSLRTERGVAEAPRMVRPDSTVDPEFLAMELANNRKTLAALAADAERIPHAPGWIPHQILGPLAAAHWLRFATMHAAHHLAIVEDVLSAG
jgi:hypothetical protein